MAELRAERMERERQERKRQEKLIHSLYSSSSSGDQTPSVDDERNDERSQRYNSQFNPDLVRVRKRRYNRDEFS